MAEDFLSEIGVELPGATSQTEDNFLSGIDLNTGFDDDFLSSIGISSDIIPSDEPGNEFSKGVKRSFNNVQAITGDAISVIGQLFGSDDIEQYGDAVSMKNRIEAANVGNAKVSRIEDVNSADDIGPWVANQFGQAIPSLFPGVAGGLATRVAFSLAGVTPQTFAGKMALTALGAYLPSSFLNTGEAVRKQKELANNEDFSDPVQALKTGLVTGSFDVVSIVPILRPLEPALKKIGKTDAVEQIAKTFDVDKNVASKAFDTVLKIGGNVVTAAALEGVTEAGQEALFIKDAEKVTGGKVSGEKFKSDVINAGIQGAFGGATYAGITSTVGPILDRAGDSGLRNFPDNSGTAIKYPDYKTFKKLATPEEQQNIKNEQDFLRVRDAEINLYVDKPARDTVRRVYELGGKPFSSNYYGRGPAQVRYFKTIKDEEGNEIDVLGTEPVPTSRFYKFKKGLGEFKDQVLDKTVGKSVSALDDLAMRSETAKKVRQQMAYYDGGAAFEGAKGREKTRISKEEVQGATIDERIFLNAGKFSVPLQKAIDIVSKSIRFPFTGAITAQTNKDLLLAVNQPIINEATVPNPKVRKAALQLRKFYDDIIKYAREADYVLDINDGKGGTLKGQKVGFDPGYIEGYYPSMYQYQKMQNDPKFNEQFIQMLQSEGFSREAAVNIRDNIVDNKGFTIALKDANIGQQPTVKAGPIEKKRELKDIPTEKLAPFINANVIDTAHRYRDAVIRRVEYARTFGKEGEVMDLALANMAAEARDAGVPMTEAEKQRMIDVGKALQKQYRPIQSSFFRKLNSALITYGYVLTLPFATISSFSEPFLVLGRGGAGPKAIAKSIVSGLKGAIRSVFPRYPRDEVDQAIANIGLGLEASVIERQTDAFGGGQDTNKITEKFFRLNFLSQFTRFNRSLAYQASQGLIFGNAQFLARNMQKRGVARVEDLPQTGRFKNKTEQLRELGVDPNDAVNFVNSDIYKSGNKEAYQATDFFQNQVRLGGVRYVNEVVMNPRATQRPMWMSDPHLAILGQLKGFQITFSNTVLKRWIRETFQSGFYNGMKNGSRYFAVGAIMVIAAALGNELREAIQYGAKGNPRRKNETDLEYVFRAVERTGFLGPIQLLLDSARAEKYGSGPVEALMGPIVHRLVSYLEGIRDLMTDGEKEKLIRELVKSVPIFGTNPQVREELYKALDVPTKFGKSGKGIL